MADGNLGTIYYTVEAHTQKLLDETRRARESVDKTGKSIKSAGKDADSAQPKMRKLSKSIVEMGKGAAITAGKLLAAKLAFDAIVNSIKALSIQAINNIDATAKMARQIGVTTEALTGLRYATQQFTSISDQGFDTALRRMTRRLTEVAQTGGGPAAKSLQSLGLEAKELARMTPDRQFLAIADAMQKMGDQGTKLRAAFGLFDTEGVGLVNALSEGSAGMEEMIKQAEKLGIVIDTEAAAAAENLRGTLDRLESAKEGLINTLAIGAIPAFETLASFIEQASTETGDLQKAADDLAKDEGMHDWIDALVLGLGLGIDMVRTLGNSLKAVSGSFKVVAADIKTLVAGAKFMQESMNPWGDSEAAAVEFAKQIKERERIIKQANADWAHLWNFDGTKYTDLAQEAVDRRRFNAEMHGPHLPTTTLPAIGVSPDPENSGSGGGNPKLIREVRAELEQNARVIAMLAQELEFAALSGEELAKAKAKAALNDAATPEEVQMVEDLASALHKIKQEEVDQKNLSRVDRIEGLKTQYEQELQLLQDLNEKKLLEDVRYLELKDQLDRRYAESMQQLEEERFMQQSWANEMIIKGLNSLEQATASALTGLISGANNGTQAIQQLAAGISQELIGALVKMGMEQVKAWAMGKVAQSAAAAGYVTSVQGQVAANTALAAQAAFASTAAIPITGPALAPAAAAAAGSEAASLGAPAIAASALTLAGARFYGGPVEGGGKMYRINEGGAPEILNSADGKQYLLPNSRGQVVSNKDATGGTQVNVSVVINSDGSISAGSDSAAWAERGREMGESVRAIVKDELYKANAAGGIIRANHYG